MYSYQYIHDTITNTNSTCYIKRLPNNAVVPFDPSNTDYQAYLEWLAAGNTPEPADQ